MSMNKNNKFNDHQIMYLTPVEAYTLMNSSMERFIRSSSKRTN